MKHVIIISKGRNTLQAFYEQLQRLIGKHAQLSGYSLEDGIAEKNLRGDLFLISSQEVRADIRRFLPPDAPVIVARRSVNYHEIGKLLEISPGTDVLLVNDMASSVYQTIMHLRVLGINHLNYHPYTPGMEDFPQLEIAVTPGESELAPECARQIVDIKTRPIDISTVVEILIRLELMEEYADFLSATYVRDIIYLTQQSMHATAASRKVKEELRTILDTVRDGIIAVDDIGRILVWNPVAEEVLGIKERDALGHIAAQLPSQWLREILRSEKEEVVQMQQRHFLVNAAAMAAGKVYILRDVSEIRRLEETARRKLVHEQKIARYHLSQVIGQSDAIGSVIKAARKMAMSDSTILIQGESGTGKEIIAQGIHNASQRRREPFVAVNFAAMTESLLESELFGYIDGAFTGASRGGAPGLFEEAHKGTIFLDEIGDAPPAFQVKLLRVLQERQVRRIGSSRLVPIDVRVIAATNCDIKELIAQGRFRKDLYYRLNVLPIALPPLRERRGDILLLAETFYDSESGKRADISAACYFRQIAAYFFRYDWPGNIRELQNVVEYLVSVCPDEAPAPRLLPVEIRDFAAEESGFAGESGRLKAQIYHEILTANRYSYSIGRRSLAERLRLPENKLRILLKEMQEDGAIVMQRGRRGLKARQKENK